VVLSEAIQKLELLRDNIDDLLLFSMERSIVAVMSLVISDVQLQNRIGADYSERYKKYRQEKGRQTAFVDLTLTGDMFRGLQIVEVEVQENGMKIYMGFTRQEDFKKYTDNRVRYGDFLALSEKEMEIYRNEVIDYISKQIKDILK